MTDEQKSRTNKINMIKNYKEENGDIVLEMETSQLHNESEERTILRIGCSVDNSSITLFNRDDIQFLYEFLLSMKVEHNF